MTDTEQYKRWLQFVTLLEQIHDTDSDAQRRQLLERFQSETVLLAYWLNRLRVTGTELSTAAGAPDHCDLCSADLRKNGLFIDGQTRAGEWAYMCMPCSGQHGSGIGWGVGQLYRLDHPRDGGEARWLCIAGGNPDPDRDASDLMA